MKYLKTLFFIALVIGVVCKMASCDTLTDFNKEQLYMRGEALLGTRLDIYDEQVPPIEDCYYDYSAGTITYHMPTEKGDVIITFFKDMDGNFTTESVVLGEAEY